ncbi:MAG: DMT family transporter, partial [Acidobacteria bacterium]|nr:DMT family transporter [Acidobacteriota bacterium]
MTVTTQVGRFRWHAVTIGLVSALLFGASIPASKGLLDYLTPFQLAGLLYLGGAAGVLSLAARSPRAGRSMIGADRRTRGLLAGAILLGGFAGPVLLLFGLRMALAGSVSLILNLEMAATACLGILLFREHLPRRGLLAVAGIVGAGILISLASGWPGVAAGLLVSLACVCWALDNHFTALIDGITPAQSTLWKGAVAGTANLAIGLYLAPLTASWTHVSVALAVGALAYGISITFYISSAQQLGATRAQGIFATAPFIGAGVA